MIEKNIRRSIDLGLISPPSAFRMPQGLPIYASITAVSLPEGCSALDNRMGFRVATGTGWSQDEADFIASIEAVERFSIQFSKSAPERVSAFFSTSGTNYSFPAKQIMIGVPDDPHGVTSQGCAASDTLDSASGKAILEILEHHHFQEFLNGNLLMTSFDVSASENLTTLVCWLEAQLRVLEVRVSTHTQLYYFAVASCSDRDGGRRTESHATGVTLQGAVDSAIQETLMYWRNMIELEKRGVDISSMSEQEALAVRKYRGASQQTSWPDNSIVNQSVNGPIGKIEFEQLAQHAKRELGADVHLVDLSHPSIGVPVVRCMAG